MERLTPWVRAETRELLESAFAHSSRTLATARAHLAQQLEEELLDELDRPLCSRLMKAAGAANDAVGEVADLYAMYLARMSDVEVRKRLRGIEHAARYEDALYAELQRNSKLLHEALLRVLMRVEPEVRAKVFDWFLL